LRTFSCRGGLLSVGVALLATATAGAFEPGENKSAIGQRAFFLPELYISTTNAPVASVLDQLPNRAAWNQLLAANKGAGGVNGFIDPRSGTASNIIGSFPLLPGSGVGNNVTLKSVSARLGRPVNVLNEAAVADLIGQFVREKAGVLGIDPSQLGPVKAAKATDSLWQAAVPQVVNGVTVRDARVVVTVKHGNVVLLGTEAWGNASIGTAPAVDPESALRLGFDFVGGRQKGDQLVKEAKLELVPTAPVEFQNGEAFAGAIGSGIGHRLVYSFQFQRSPDMGLWELMVDAGSGEVISLQDKNQYADASITGGVYPLTNTGICPNPQFCGTMQSGWPMMAADTGFASPNNFTDSGGIYNYTSGTATTTLTGRFVDVNDTCGTISASSASGSIDLGGANNQHDCTVPAGNTFGAGNTPAMRTAFFELNKLIEQAKGWLPTNTWLQSTLTANLNINLTCNAFWSSGAGTVNFYRSGGGCRNTGEIAAVFDHEWGHGMDDNDTLGALSSSSEAYADIASIYRLQASCVGHGFADNSSSGTCGLSVDGMGRNANEALTGPAHCALDCAGVRDTDWDKHADHTPDTPLNHNCPRCTTGPGPCGRQVHCSAAPVRQAAWDFVARDLVGAPFNLTTQQAFVLGNKIFYEGSGSIGAWHACTCGVSSDGCAAANGYMQWLAADDDNGSLADGTPHMTALFNAYNRHQIACTTPTVQNSGCSGQPTGKAAVWVVSGSSQNTINWDAMPGVTAYWVFRTEGHAGCLYGKVRIATVNAPGTSFVDTNVQPGRTYSYNVLPVGTTDDCMGTLSRCVQAVALP
jgi:trimeric autotransporter adhesin